MELIPVILIAAISFGLFYLMDKGFTRLFRGQAQHRSGQAIRLNKRYASFGLILMVLGVGSMFAYTTQGWIMLAAGALILLVGIGMIVYYMTFGVFYDQDAFVLTTFGRKSATYRYNQIRGQMLYTGSGNIIVELHMTDDRTFQLPLSMEGAEAFLNKAFAAWCRQTGTDVADCDFYDPDNSCWFPGLGG